MSTKTEDTRTAIELEAAVLAGETVTPAQLGAARERDRLAELEAQAARLKAEREAETAHDRQLAQLRADIEAIPNSAADLAELADKATAALSDLIGAMKERDRRIQALAARAAALGINELRPDEKVRHRSGIGWRRVGGRGGSLLMVDDRKIRTPRSPLQLINRVAHDARDAHGIHHTDPEVVSNFAPRPVAEQLDALDHYGV